MAYKNNETAREWARHRKGSSNEYGLGNAKGLSLAPERNLASYGVNLSDHAQKQIKEAYASTFANSYDYNVDQERMAKGLMPTAFDSKYQDTELDRLLYSMGLPSAADLPQAVDEYNEKNAPERQYQQVYNAIGKDVRPFLDENGELSENKVLDYLYKTVFVEDEFSDLKGKWDEYKEPSSEDEYDTYEASLRAGLKNDTSDYNIKKLMDDLKEGLKKANMWNGLAPVSSDKGREETNVIPTVGRVSENKSAEEKYFAEAEKAQQLYDEIRFLSQSGIDTTEKQAELDALMKKAEEVDPKRQQKEQWKAEDALLREAVDLSLLRRENIPLSGPGEIVYSEELQAQVDAFRDQQIANGMTPLQVDNIIRRSGLNAYINNNVEIADFAASVIAEQKGITFDQAMAEYNAMPQSEKDMYAMDMQFDNRVHNSATEEAGRAAAAIPARVALDIVNSAFNFSDMMNPMAGIQNAIYDMAGIADPSEKIRETLNAVSWKLGQFGSSENHEFINVASDVTTELIRMYAVNSAGVALAQGVNAPALAGKTPAPEKGMGVLLNKVAKIYNTKSAPFIASAMGSYYNEAMSEGASKGQATAYALIAGSFEGALEAVNADEIFKKTLSSRFIQQGKAGTKHLLSKGVSRFVNFAASMIGNAAEEAGSYATSWITARVLYDKGREFSKEEFLENAGMGALIGTAGAIATMGEGSRSYDLLQKSIDKANDVYRLKRNIEQSRLTLDELSGEVAEMQQTLKEAQQLFDEAQAAYEVETMPQGKYDAQLQNAMELSVDELVEAQSLLYKAVERDDNAKKVLNRRVAAQDERLAAAENKHNALLEKIRVAPNNTAEDNKRLAQLFSELETARNTLAKTIESVDEAKTVAQTEYEAKHETFLAEINLQQRRIDDHHIAYDLRMQQMMVRQDVEQAISELDEIRTRLAGLDEAYRTADNPTAVQMIEEARREYDGRISELEAAVDEGIRTEEWIAMENKSLSESWANDTAWQEVLRVAAETRSSLNAQAAEAAYQPINFRTGDVRFKGRKGQSAVAETEAGGVASDDGQEAAIETATATFSVSPPPNEDIAFDVDTTEPPEIETSQDDDSVFGIVDPRINETITALRRTGRAVYQATVSGQAPLERIAKKQTGLENGKANLNDLAQMVRTSGAGVKTVLYDRFMDKDGVDLNLGSWKDMVASIPKGLESDFMRYCLLLHSADRMSLEARGFGENKPVFAKEGNENGKQKALSSEESAQQAAELAEKHPEFVALANKMQNWWDTFMRKWAVDGGLISSEAYEHMREMYPHYVPTFRVGKKRGDSSISQGATSIGIADPVRKAVGSFDTVANIYDSFARQINKMIRSERANEMLLSLYSFAERNPNIAAGEGVILLDNNTETVDAEQDLDVSMDSLALETLEKTKDGNYIVRARRDGKVVAMQVSPEIYMAVDLLIGSSYGDSSKAQVIDKVFKGLNSLANVFKGGITTYNPLFALTNMVRDFQTSFVNSEANIPEYFGNIKNAIAGISQNSKEWQDFQAFGGRMTGYVGSDKGFLVDAFGKQKTSKRVMQKVKDVLSAPGEFTESVFRFSEYLQGLRMYGDTPDGRRKAAQMAADVSVNFSKSAPVSKAISTFTLYFNAQVQGIDRLARQLKNAPLKTAAKNIPFAAIAAALLKLVGNEDNPHYQNLTDNVKDNYFLIPHVLGERDADGNCITFIKVPKSREYGVMMVALVERAFEAARTGDIDTAFDGWAETVLANFVPSNPIKEHMFAPLNVFETNKNYYGGDVVPGHMQYEAPKDQYTAQTSMVARRMAEVLSSLGKDVSPMHIDYVINQLGGIYGQVLTAATAEDATGLGSVTLEMLEDKFVADPLYSSGIVSRFYDVCDEAKSSASDASVRRKENGDSVLTVQERQYKKLENYKQQISNLRKKERQLLAEEKDTKERKAKIDAIRAQINDIASKAVLEYEPQS